MTADILQLAREALEDDKRATNEVEIATVVAASERVQRALIREPKLAAEVVRLTERQQELLRLVANISQSAPLESEVQEALAQRGALLAKIGTLTSDRDQLQAECEKLRIELKVAEWSPLLDWKRKAQEFEAQLAAMTAARNELAQIADDRKLPDRISLRTQQEDMRIAALRAVGGKETM